MTGQIVGISYDNYALSRDVCYIAINDESSEFGFYFHRVWRDQMCSFAESSIIMGHTVKVIGDTSMIGANSIRQIEYASTNATKWWSR